MNIIRKGQVEGVGEGAIRGQVRFVSNLFMIAAQVGVRVRPFMSLLIFLQHNLDSAFAAKLRRPSRRT
jgi:hypothetical protein